MNEVRRSIACPACGLRFLIVFDSGQPLGDAPVRTECPRTRNGRTCKGRIDSHVPTRYRVVVAEALESWT